MTDPAAAKAQEGAMLDQLTRMLRSTTADKSGRSISSAIVGSARSTSAVLRAGHSTPRGVAIFQKGGDPAAPSDTATLLRLHPSHEPCRGNRPPCG
jgi:hypothetical protein